MFPLKNRKLIRGAQAHVKAGLGIGADYVAIYEEFVIPFDGVVTTYWGDEGGYWLRITRPNGHKVELAHLSKYKVKNGQVVKAGEVGGVTGNTGGVTSGPHLHIQIFNKEGQRLDPETYIWEETTYPVNIRMCVLMNYPQAWKEPFGELRELVYNHSGKRIFLDIYPVYTDFKKEDLSKQLVYESSNAAEFYSVIDRKYFNEYLLPLRFGDPHITAFCMANSDFTGKPFNNPNDKEFGWYYRKTVVKGDTSHLPPKLFTVQDEGQKGYYYPEMSALTENLYHELLHFLYDKGHPSQFDFTHTLHSTRQIEKAFDDIDYGLLIKNLS